jgi:hypothetical protein
MISMLQTHDKTVRAHARLAQEQVNSPQLAKGIWAIHPGLLIFFYERGGMTHHPSIENLRGVMVVKMLRQNALTITMLLESGNDIAYM